MREIRFELYEYLLNGRPDSEEELKEIINSYIANSDIKKDDIDP